jgi:integrase/recombinase XerD
MGILRDRMTEEMKLRNFSPATQKSYLYAVTRLAKYYGKAPDQLDKEQIRSYLVHLTVGKKLSPNTMTGFICGLRFFYNETLGWDETKLFIPPRKKSSSLPEVFSPSEVVRLIDAARGLKQRVLLMTGYSAGLRVGEFHGAGRMIGVKCQRCNFRAEFYVFMGPSDRHTSVKPVS